MTGPSSSHTAGAARLSRVARHIAEDDVAEVKFTLYGSFAETGRGHGTDKALIAGALGMEPDDPRIKDAYRVAREMGVLVTMEFSEEQPAFPNTARIVITGSNGQTTDVVGESVAVETSALRRSTASRSSSPASIRRWSFSIPISPASLRKFLMCWRSST